VTVEFALVVPLFFLFAFASFEFSRLNFVRHAVDNAAYEAARVGIVPGANVNTVRDRANHYLDNIAKVTGSTVIVTPNPITSTANEITVSIIVPLDQNAWVTPKFAAGKTITRSSTLRTERYRGIE
jgi:Flp pilus assembly protein TadG